MGSKASHNLKKATWGEIILYSFGPGMGINLGYILVSMYFMFFATDYMGLSALLIGNILLICRIMSIFSDPIIGILSDRTNTVLGRYRPWILVGSFIYGVSVVMLFWGPNLSTNGKTIFIVIANIIFTWGYSMTNVPGHSLRAVITQDPIQRAYLAIPSSILVMIAALMAGALPVVLVKGMGGGIIGYRYMSILFGILIIISFLLTFIGVRKHDNMKAYEHRAKNSLKDFFTVLKKNRALTLLGIAVGTNFIATTTIQAVQIYILKYIIGDEGLMVVIGGISILIITVFSILASIAVKKIDKKVLFIFGSYSGLIIPIILILFPSIFTNIPLFIVLTTINMAVGPFTTTVQWAMLPDCVEYGEWKTGIRAEGAVTSVFTAINKAGMAIGAGMVGLVLAKSSYIANAAEQTMTVQKALIGLYCAVPIFGHICSIIAVHFYPITTENYYTMVEEIETLKEKTC